MSARTSHQRSSSSSSAAPSSAAPSSSTRQPSLSASNSQRESKDDPNDPSQKLSPIPSVRANRLSRPKGPSSIQLKVGMLGDSYVGKTSLMVKYVENKFDEDYIQTLGIDFMQKMIQLRERTITFTIFDLGGGENEFNSMIPLVCADASTILFTFDLTRRSTLQSVRNWYRQARGFNQMFIPFLVGTKFDSFFALSIERQKDTLEYARNYAKAMKAPLIFTSAKHSINVQRLFKVVLSKRFGLKCNVPQVSNLGEPILEY